MLVSTEPFALVIVNAPFILAVKVKLRPSLAFWDTALNERTPVKSINLVSPVESKIALSDRQLALNKNVLMNVYCPNISGAFCVVLRVTEKFALLAEINSALPASGLRQVIPPTPTL